MQNQKKRSFKLFNNIKEEPALKKMHIQSNDNNKQEKSTYTLKPDKCSNIQKNTNTNNNTNNLENIYKKEIKTELITHVNNNNNNTNNSTINSTNNSKYISNERILTISPYNNINTSPAINNNRIPTWIDITYVLSLPQKEAAKLLNMPNSTVSKRWSESLSDGKNKGKKWPYRQIKKTDKKIVMQILQYGKLPEKIIEEDVANIVKLLITRDKNLPSCIIRFC